jgi:hypothetical protein
VVEQLPGRWFEAMSTPLEIELPKLAPLDKEDVRAIRSFLPGKLLGRTAAFLSLSLLVLGFVVAIKVSLHQFPDLERAIPAWAWGMLLGLCFLAVAAQVALEWRAERSRRVLQLLAVKPDAVPTGYFRIGPYQDLICVNSGFAAAKASGKPTKTGVTVPISRFHGLSSVNVPAVVHSEHFRAVTPSGQVVDHRQNSTDATRATDDATADLSRQPSV